MNGVFDEVSFNTSAPAITNLLQYTEQFDVNTFWIKTRSNIGATNAVVAPNGTLTADKLIEDTTATQSHYINGPSTAAYVTSSSLPVGSIYVKAGERTSCGLAIVRDAGTAFASGTFNVDLSAGTVLSGTGNIASAGNGWYRISTPATTFGANYALRLLLNQSGTTSTYTGDGTSGLYIWGAQLEPGSVATTYQGKGASTILTPTWATRTVPSTVYTTGLFDEVTYNSTTPTIKNLLWQTQNWTANIQSSANVSVTANSIQAPDGTQTGSTITTTVGGYNNDALIQKWNPTGIPTSALPYCLSVFVKQGNCPTVGLNLAFYNGNTYQDAILTLTWANLSISTAGGTNTGTLNYGVTDAGAGWYRLWCSATNNYSAVGVVGRIWVRSVYNNNVAGDSNYAWGIQIEQGSSPTSYQGKGASTILTPNFARRDTSQGNVFVTNSFDEFTGAPVVDSSLKIWYDAGQIASYPGSGTTVYDLSGNGNTGTLGDGGRTGGNGTPTFVVSIPSFTGNGNSQIEFANASSINSATTISLNWWGSFTGFNSGNEYNNIVSMREVYASTGYRFGPTTAGLAVFWTTQTGGNIRLVSNSTMTTNTTYNLCVTYDGTVGRMYQNGTIVASQIGTYNPIQSTVGWVGGNNEGCIGANIKYSTFQWYHRSLSADEVAQNFNALCRRYNI